VAEYVDALRGLFAGAAKHVILAPKANTLIKDTVRRIAHLRNSAWFIEAIAVAITKPLKGNATNGRHAPPPFKKGS
jgi:hypothetical protein